MKNEPNVRIIKIRSISLLCIAAIAIGLVAGYSWHAQGDRRNHETAPSRGSTPKQARHGIGLPYAIAGSPNGPGHHIYRFGGRLGVVSRAYYPIDDFFGMAAQSDYTPADAVIRFVGDAPPQHAPAGSQSTGREIDAPSISALR